MSPLPFTKKRTGICHPFFLFIFLLPAGILAQNVGLNTLSPSAGLHVESDNGLLVKGEFGTGGFPLSGYGTRLMWSSKTGSLRAGRITDEDSGAYQDWWDFFNTGDYSFATGLNTKASAFASFSAGHKNQATGYSSFAAGGIGNTASGWRSFSTGVYNTAPSFAEFVAGMYATEYTPENTVGFDEDDRLFVIGNGAHINARNNAMTILKNGNTGIGTASPQYRMHISGNSAIDNGRLSFINTNSSVFIGHDAGNLTSSFNTAVGTEALKNTTDQRNAAFGYQALSLGTNGSDNTAMGYQALYNNSSTNNTAIGIKSGHQNNSHSNTFLGAYAGEFSTGSGNVFIGKFAGQNETDNDKLYIDNTSTSTPLIHGDFTEDIVTINSSLVTTNFKMTNGAGADKLLQSDANGNASWVNPSAVFSDEWNSSGGHIYNANTLNVGIGTSSPTAQLHVNGNVRFNNTKLSITGTGESVFIGENAGANDDLSSNQNVFIGKSAGNMNTTGEHNIAIGSDAASSNETSSRNIAIGKSALASNTGGNANIAIGTFTLDNLTTGSGNVGIGQEVLSFISTTSGNTAVGNEAGRFNEGSRNTFLGYRAGLDSEGSDNIFIGYHAGYFEAGNSKLYVDNSNTSSPLIYGDFDSNKLTINDSIATKALHLTDGNLTITTGRIDIKNGGRSTLVGFNSGINDVESGFNEGTFVGYRAGESNTSGGENTAIGAYSLQKNLTGSQNTALGNHALLDNLTGAGNVALGYQALTDNTGGVGNVAVGTYTLAQSTNSKNTAIGLQAGNHTTTGHSNLYLGAHSGENNNGTANVFIGYASGQNETGSNKLIIDNSNTTSPLIHGDFSTNKVTINDSLATKYFQMTNGASDNYVLKSNSNGRGSWTEPSLLFHELTMNNLFIGEEVGDAVTSAVDNTIIGPYAGVSLTTGYENTGLGFWSLLDLTTGTSNTALGHNTLANNLSGSNNTAVGWSALSGTTGGSNTAVGAAAGGENTSGARNVYIGYEAGSNNQGSDNILIGYRAGKNEAGSNKLYIENSDSATPLIAGDFTTNEVTINDSLTVGKELSVGTSVASSTLEVNGSVATKFKTPLVAGTTHPDGSGMVWRYNSGTGTIMLPGAGTCANRIYVIINQTGTTRNISTYRDLTTTNQTTIGSSVALWLMSDGVEWWQIK